MQTFGTGEFLLQVRTRSEPSLSSKHILNFQKGDTVTYDSVINKEGRTWISFLGNSGNRNYCCAIDIDGEVLIKCTSSSQPQAENTISRGGETGFPKIPRQGAFSQGGIAVSGCLFLSACVKGGCTTQDQCLKAWEWATSCGKVRESDAYVNCRGEILAREIANELKLNFHEDYDICNNAMKSHFYVRQNGIEIFNSAGLGYNL